MQGRKKNVKVQKKTDTYTLCLTTHIQRVIISFNSLYTHEHTHICLTIAKI